MEFDELFFKVFANLVPFIIIFFVLVEAQHHIHDGLIVKLIPILLMSFVLVGFEGIFGDEDIGELGSEAVAHFAHIVGLDEMLFKVSIVFVVDVFGLFLVVLFADEALLMSGISKMGFELINIIKSFSTIVAIGVIDDDFSILAVLAFFQVGLELRLGVESVFGWKAFSVIKAHITGLENRYQNCFRWTSLRCFLS